MEDGRAAPRWVWTGPGVGGSGIWGGFALQEWRRARLGAPTVLCAQSSGQPWQLHSPCPPWGEALSRFFRPALPLLLFCLRQAAQRRRATSPSAMPTRSPLSPWRRVSQGPPGCHDFRGWA